MHINGSICNLCGATTYVCTQFQFSMIFSSFSLLSVLFSQLSILHTLLSTRIMAMCAEKGDYVCRVAMCAEWPCVQRRVAMCAEKGDPECRESDHMCREG